jgi:hypothetical protein
VPLPRHLTAVSLGLAVLLTGCGGEDEPRDEAGRVGVGDLALDTPAGWERVDEPADPPLVSRTRFVDPDQRLQLVQVIVGCDDAGLDALVGAVGQPRGALVVTAAEELVPPPEVEGLDRTRRVTLELARDPDAATTSRIEALYGQRGDALVLVEVSVPVDGGAVDADAVLASLIADGDALGSRCPD